MKTVTFYVDDNHKTALNIDKIRKCSSATALISSNR